MYSNYSTYDASRDSILTLLCYWSSHDSFCHMYALFGSGGFKMTISCYIHHNHVCMRKPSTAPAVSHLRKLSTMPKGMSFPSTFYLIHSGTLYERRIRGPCRLGNWKTRERETGQEWEQHIFSV